MLKSKVTGKRSRSMSELHSFTSDLSDSCAEADNDFQMPEGYFLHLMCYLQCDSPGRETL